MNSTKNVGAQPVVGRVAPMLDEKEFTQFKAAIQLNAWMYGGTGTRARINHRRRLRSPVSHLHKTLPAKTPTTTDESETRVERPRLLTRRPSLRSVGRASRRMPGATNAALIASTPSRIIGEKTTTIHAKDRNVARSRGSTPLFTGRVVMGLPDEYLG
ncbi:MAG: hypothetical protein NTV61_04400 [Candidatus Bathyarchaeota archaeon]|nr:hypothetical protein [Candidatus Bathyarchaeota archaeon]